MIPIVTPEEMREIDASTTVPTRTLIARAGWAVASEVVRRGGAYGRRVVVVCGPGNNGADGRVAAAVLRRRGASCEVFDVEGCPPRLPDCDVVIDAAFGTGLRDPWSFPQCRAPLTVAVDIPSGVDGLTGVAHGEPRPADVTVTFAAAKPGLYCNDGLQLCGEVVVADIGLDVDAPRMGVAEPADLADALARRPRHAHKWHQSVWVVAGSPGMLGAGELSAAAAMRAGASYVRWSPVDVESTPRIAMHPEVVIAPHDASDAAAVAADAARFAAGVIGPGLGRDESVADMAREVARVVAMPLVMDADALWALGESPVPSADPAHPRIMTPHDGEYEFLMGHRPGANRIDAALALATRHHAIALLKGPSTIVAAPDGRVRVVAAGDQRLATAGTGDVLSGCLAGCLAAGIDAFDAAWSASLLCALAARRAPAAGMVAGDLLDTLPVVLSEVHP